MISYIFFHRIFFSNIALVYTLSLRSEQSLMKISLGVANVPTVSFISMHTIQQIKYKTTFDEQSGKI